MGSIYRTNNPNEYAEVDGIVIDEKAPPAGVQSVGSGTVILVGQFQRGPQVLKPVGSTNELYETFGKSDYQGDKELRNKRFSSLKIIRVIASDAAKGAKTFQDAGGSPADRVTFTAKHKGLYGNLIKITIEAGSVSGKKYTVQDLNTDASTYFPTEVYDNVAIADVVTKLAGSKLVDVTLVSAGAEPANVAATALVGGSDGTIADTDYENALALAEADGAGNFVFFDVYNQTRNSYLKIHVGLTQDKMCICAELEDDTVSENETDVALLRDVDGRVIYASNWIETVINGSKVYTSPASWLASILSQTSPHVDPASSENSQFLYGVTGVKKNLSRTDFKRLMAAGVCSFEFDNDIGFKVRSGVVTQIANSSKLMIFRRRMADWITGSLGKFLKVYQNNVNSADKRTACVGAMKSWDGQQEILGILPKDSEVEGGKAKIYDGKTLNSNDSIAQGKFFIKVKRRIYSSMRFIVLIAEIGESVVVTEADE
jgi:hypothetical protein